MSGSNVQNPDNIVRFSNVRAIESTNQFRTGSKLVLNRFWSIRTIGTGSKPVLVRNPDVISGFQTLYIYITSINRTILSGYRTSGSFQSSNRTSDNRTRLYALGRPIAGDSKSGRFFVWFSKPDVRFSDIHCSSYQCFEIKSLPYLLN